MPSEKQIEAGASVLVKYCGKGHAMEFARAVLIAAERVAPVQLMRARPPTELDMFDDWPKDYAEQFWKAYPHKRTKATALKALDKVKASHVPWVTLMHGLERYIAYVNSRSDLNWMHPATWLNGMSWEDDFAPVKENGRTTNGFAAIARQG